MIDLYRLIGPGLRAIDPETAHRCAIRALAMGLVPGGIPAADPILQNAIWGRRFSHPLGLAAGFDKNAEALAGAFKLGFAFVEIGSVTPRPQKGNPRPRLFRLSEDRAVINRMGFNNDGMVAVAARLARWRAAGGQGCLGVNLGKNKETEDAGADYALGLARLAPYADYLTINVSSPNTPGLRALQDRAALEALIRRLQAARESLPLRHRPPLLVKVAPDLSADDRRDIAAVALATELDGLIVSNTTLARPPQLKSRHRGEAGGLSGRPLLAPSSEILADFYRLTEGRLLLVGVGGIDSGAAAYAKIRAGASLLQLYSALVYEGPALIGRILSELALLLRADGFQSLAQAVGADHR